MVAEQLRHCRPALPLSWPQGDVRLNGPGHEWRINAEKSDRFSPCPQPRTNQANITRRAGSAFPPSTAQRPSNQRVLLEGRGGGGWLGGGPFFPMDHEPLGSPSLSCTAAHPSRNPLMRPAALSWRSMLIGRASKRRSRWHSGLIENPEFPPRRLRQSIGSSRFPRAPRAVSRPRPRLIPLSPRYPAAGLRTAARHSSRWPETADDSGAVRCGRSETAAAAFRSISFHVPRPASAAWCPARTRSTKIRCDPSFEQVDASGCAKP